MCACPSNPRGHLLGVRLLRDAHHQAHFLNNSRCDERTLTLEIPEYLLFALTSGTIPKLEANNGAPAGLAFGVGFFVRPTALAVVLRLAEIGFGATLGVTSALSNVTVSDVAHSTEILSAGARSDRLPPPGGQRPVQCPEKHVKERAAAEWGRCLLNSQT